MMLLWENGSLVLPDGLQTLFLQIGEACLAKEGIACPIQVSIVWANQQQIQRVNRQMRGINQVTDVLSFPAVAYPIGQTARGNESRIRRELDPETGHMHLGDIMICMPQVQCQALTNGHSFLREAGYMMAHGMCHLLGYDHMTNSERAQMRVMEEMALQSVGLARLGYEEENGL